MLLASLRPALLRDLKIREIIAALGTRNPRNYCCAGNEEAEPGNHVVFIVAPKCVKTWPSRGRTCRARDRPGCRQRLQLQLTSSSS